MWWWDTAWRTRREMRGCAPVLGEVGDGGWAEHLGPVVRMELSSWAQEQRGDVLGWWGQRGRA